jgi:MFS transporter, SP family, arabinose:H+ symporter
MKRFSHVSNDNSINLPYVLFLACTAALGGLLFGFDIAIITGAGPFITRHFSLSDLGLGWAFSSLLFGCVFGSFVSGRLADRYGRKPLLLIVAVLFALTSIATALAPSFTAFITARLLGGIAVGGVSLLSPMYVAEVSPPSIRGRMGTLYQMSIVVGIIVSYGINFLLRNTGPDNWRWMFASGVVPSVVFLACVLAAPESPRFMALKGRREDAFVLLERISGKHLAQAQFTEIESSLHKEAQNWRSLLHPGMRRVLAVSIGLSILIHFSGINTVIDYAPAIFQSAGWKVDAALASTFLTGLTELLFTIVSLWFIDRYGRKPLYLVGSTGMGLCLLTMVWAVLLGHFHGGLVLALILSYLAFFSACIGPVYWTLVPEIFPNDIRGMAMTVPVLVQWIANAIVVLLFPYAFQVIGKAFTFGVLALMAFSQGAFTLLYVPETKGKSLEEIEKTWNASAEVAIRKTTR